MHKLRSDLPFSTRQGRVRSICAARPPLGLDDQRRPPARALNFARPVRGAQLELFQIYKLADFHDGRGRAVLPMTLQLPSAFAGTALASMQRLSAGTSSEVHGEALASSCRALARGHHLRAIGEL